MSNKNLTCETELMTLSEPSSNGIPTAHDTASNAPIYVPLPWEDGEAYRALLHELTETHHPQGATERFLIEELAALMWRKRRLHLAEAASFRHGLEHVTRWTYEPVAKAALVAHVRQVKGRYDAVKDALLLSDQEAEGELAEMYAVEKKVQRALRLLGNGKPDAYEQALRALLPETRAWWQETLEEAAEDVRGEEAEPSWQATLESLAEFLKTEVLSWVEQRITELTYRADIRLQALGEALSIHQLLNLSRYEAHLTAQFRQTLAMLVELQTRRQDGSA